MSGKRINLGQSGEQAAAQYLKNKGHRILERNFRTRLGEIDLITRHRKTTVFVEVKSRLSDSHGSPLEAVTPFKQAQIGKVALEYLSRHKLFDTDARFDVISIYYKNNTPLVEHIENAFELNYG